MFLGFSWLLPGWRVWQAMVILFGVLYFVALVGFLCGFLCDVAVGLRSAG